MPINIDIENIDWIQCYEDKDYYQLTNEKIKQKYQHPQNLSQAAFEKYLYLSQLIKMLYQINQVETIFMRFYVLTLNFGKTILNQQLKNRHQTKRKINNGHNFDKVMNQAINTMYNSFPNDFKLPIIDKLLYIGNPNENPVPVIELRLKENPKQKIISTMDNKVERYTHFDEIMMNYHNTQTRFLAQTKQSKIIKCEYQVFLKHRDSVATQENIEYYRFIIRMRYLKSYQNILIRKLLKYYQRHCQAPLPSQLVNRIKQAIKD